jgi:hypothetical protein
MSTPAVSTNPDVSPADPGAERRPNDGRSPGEDASSSRERARRAVTQGMKAAGLTAAGFGVGTLVESHTKLSRKLGIVRRPRRTRAIRQAIVKRLP